MRCCGIDKMRTGLRLNARDLLGSGDIEGEMSNGLAADPFHGVWSSVAMISSTEAEGDPCDMTRQGEIVEGKRWLNRTEEALPATTTNSNVDTQAANLSILTTRGNTVTRMPARR